MATFRVSNEIEAPNGEIIQIPNGRISIDLTGKFQYYPEMFYPENEDCLSDIRAYFPKEKYDVYICRDIPSQEKAASALPVIEIYTKDTDEPVAIIDDIIEFSNEEYNNLYQILTRDTDPTCSKWLSLEEEFKVAFSHFMSDGLICPWLNKDALNIITELVYNEVMMADTKDYITLLYSKEIDVLAQNAFERVLKELIRGRQEDT